MLFKWTPNFVPNKVFIFGCGGTGSRVVPLVAQFMKSCPWVVNPEIVLVDFDTVEEKNLLRQNFIQSDVGKNKAIVLASRYSRAFNITITPLITKVTRNWKTDAESSTLERFVGMIESNDRRNNLFILCVDSPNARRDIVNCILTYAGQNPYNLIIDAGNENDFGQVVVSSTQGMDTGSYDRGMLEKLKQEVPVELGLPFIPMNPAYFDEMQTVSTPSCAELDQTMAINTLMAVNIFGIIQNIYYVKPMSFYRIDVSMQYGSIPQQITVHSLKACTNKTNREDKVGGTLRRFQFHGDLQKLYRMQEEFLITRDIAEREAARKREREAKEAADKLAKDHAAIIKKVKENDAEPASTLGEMLKKKMTSKVDEVDNIRQIDTVLGRLAALDSTGVINLAEMVNATTATNASVVGGAIPAAPAGRARR